MRKKKERKYEREKKEKKECEREREYVDAMYGNMLCSTNVIWSIQNSLKARNLGPGTKIFFEKFMQKHCTRNVLKKCNHANSANYVGISSKSMDCKYSKKEMKIE